MQSNMSQFRQICVACVHPGPKWQLPSALVSISIAFLGNLVWLVCKPSVQFFSTSLLMSHTFFAAGSSSDWEGFQLDWGQASCQATSWTYCCHYLSAKCCRWVVKETNMIFSWFSKSDIFTFSYTISKRIDWEFWDWARFEEILM